MKLESISAFIKTTLYELRQKEFRKNGVKVFLNTIKITKIVLFEKYCRHMATSDKSNYSKQLITR